MIKNTVWVGLLAAAIAVPLPVLAQTEASAERACRGLGIEGLLQQILTGGTRVVPANLIEFCDGYREVREGLAALRSQVDDLRDRMPPHDAILIVDDSNGCPRGWRDLAEDEPAVFAGRMALAATGDGPYRYRATHGAATHTLSVAEMPAHSHRNPTRGRDNNSGTETGYPWALQATGQGNYEHHERRTERSGGGMPHNNMPPYVALYFCKKDG
jgi:hypothetical protein